LPGAKGEDDVTDELQGEEEIILWQDVLDQIQAGRPDGIVCPFCKGGALVVEREQVRGLRVHCPKCKKFIQGSLAEAE
jgi:hypothetical protein